MREIKFKAWDIKEKKMISWSCMRQEAFNRGGVSLFYMIFTDSNFVPMQYTGLKDKKDKEIYESDICEVTYRDVTYHLLEKELLLVKYEQGNFVFNYNISNFWVCGSTIQAIKIVGNKYENPELIEE